MSAARLQANIKIIIVFSTWIHISVIKELSIKSAVMIYRTIMLEISQKKGRKHDNNNQTNLVFFRVTLVQKKLLTEPFHAWEFKIILNKLICFNPNWFPPTLFWTKDIFEKSVFFTLTTRILSQEFHLMVGRWFKIVLCCTTNLKDNSVKKRFEVLFLILFISKYWSEDLKNWIFQLTKNTLGCFEKKKVVEIYKK